MGGWAWGSPHPRGKGRVQTWWIPPSHSQAPGSLQEEEGRDDSDALELYQQSLGELLLLLAGELGLWQGF